VASRKYDKADQSTLLRILTAKQRNVLDLFQRCETVTTRQIGDFFGYHQQTARALCRKWVEGGFLIIVDPSKKGRKYQLAPRYFPLLNL